MKEERGDREREERVFWVEGIVCVKVLWWEDERLKEYYRGWSIESGREFVKMTFKIGYFM